MTESNEAILRTHPLTVVVVQVDALRCGLNLDSVVDVLPAVATLPLPGSPDIVHGVIDLHGELVPVLDLRSRLGLPPRAPHPHDHVVVCLLGERRVGVWVDRAEGITVVQPHDMARADELVAAEFLAGVARLDDGLLLVYDVRAFLSVDELLLLDSAVRATSSAMS